MLLQANPCGKIAIGFESVSCVGVIAALASHRIGPSPTITSSTSSAVWAPPSPHLTLGASSRRTEPGPAGSRLPGVLAPTSLQEPDGAHSSLQARVARR